MNTFLKEYKSFAISFFLVLGVLISLQFQEIIRIPPFKEAFLEIILIFIFWWALVSFILYRLTFILQKTKATFATIGLILLFCSILIFDGYYIIPDNPITISLVTVFWNIVFYILDPTFYKKYKLYILSSYGILLGYFLYIRMFTAYIHNDHIILINMAMFTFPVIIGLWFFEQWKRVKKLKEEKSAAELELLKSQINPHFFFNTLNNLYGLTIEKSDEAPKVILKLSEMMRYTIYEGKEDFVSLKEEMKYLEHYIDLHKIRYHKHVDIHFDYDKEIDCKIAPLLFIILLENAFKHGVERLTHSAFVHLYLSLENGLIHFEIENNFEHQKNKKTKGIGLLNLEKRLNLIYPRKHSLKVIVGENTYKVILKIDTK